MQITTSAVRNSWKAEGVTSVDILACPYTKLSQVVRLLRTADSAALRCILRRNLTGIWPLCLLPRVSAVDLLRFCWQDDSNLFYFQLIACFKATV